MLYRFIICICFVNGWYAWGFSAFQLDKFGRQFTIVSNGIIFNMFIVFVRLNILETEFTSFRLAPYCCLVFDSIFKTLWYSSRFCLLSMSFCGCFVGDVWEECRNWRGVEYKSGSKTVPKATLMESKVDQWSRTCVLGSKQLTQAGKGIFDNASCGTGSN